MKITEFMCICMSDYHVVCFFRDGAEMFFAKTNSGKETLFKTNFQVSFRQTIKILKEFLSICGS